MAAKLNRLQERSRLPLLIASDLEGRHRHSSERRHAVPPNMGVAATGSDSDAYQLGRITALEGRAVGIHLAFAPVADVNNNPANPIINARSFGEDPRRWAAWSRRRSAGFRNMACSRRPNTFPGTATPAPTRTSPSPVITADWARLDSVELVPFRSAIAAGV